MWQNKTFIFWCKRVTMNERSTTLRINRYAGLLVLHLLPFLNPWLIVKMIPAYIFSIGITLVDVHLNWLNWFLILILEGGLLIILIDCMISLSPFLDVTRMPMLIISFLTLKALEYSAYRMFSFDLWSKSF